VFSVGMTGRAAPTATPLVHLDVVAVAGLLTLVAGAVPDARRREYGR
jgi:putative ABC transport system permease protein